MKRTYPNTQDEQAHTDTAIVVVPDIMLKTNTRSLPHRVEEAEGLARAINLHIIDTVVKTPKKIVPGSFFTKGIKDDIKERVDALKPTIVVVDHTFSPVQQRNLEKYWNCKVIDRTGLILEIFGARAQTKEGKIQVELAALEYQRSRLVRSWTHLERQRGGAGFMGGPGETQIEIDRRLIGDRIVKLKKQLDDVRRTRDLGRQARERVPFPVVALVGYTNAGKSTLFNTITGAGVYAEDLPFATLDPTLRRITLPSGQESILSDTVGFISDLPTHLVASFRATLEQTIHADVIVHVRDVSRPDHVSQAEDVVRILEDLGIEYETDERIIEVYNKIDVLNETDRNDILRDAKFDNGKIAISAIKNIGLDDLLKQVMFIIERERRTAQFALDIADGRALSWLYEHAQVIERTDEMQKIYVSVHIDPANLQRFIDEFGYTPHIAMQEHYNADISSA